MLKTSPQNDPTAAIEQLSQDVANVTQLLNQKRAKLSALSKDENKHRALYRYLPHPLILSHPLTPYITLPHSSHTLKHPTTPYHTRPTPFTPYILQHLLTPFHTLSHPPTLFHTLSTPHTWLQARSFRKKIMFLNSPP